MGALILTLVLGTLLTTVGIIAIVGYRSSRDAISELNTQYYFLAISEVRNQTSRIFESVLLITREFQVLLSKEFIPQDDMRKLAFILAERLRQEDDVDEICYTTLPEGDYVCANGMLFPGKIVIRRALSGILAKQTSDIVSPAGKLTPADDPYWKKPYDPRIRPWFQDIMKGDGRLVWTRPFPNFGRSIYCLGVGVLIFDKEESLEGKKEKEKNLGRAENKKRPKGIFMVHSSADKLKEQLSYLQPWHDRLLFVILGDNNWVLTQHTTISHISENSLRDAAIRIMDRTRRTGPKREFRMTSMTFNGSPFELAWAEIDLQGGLRCTVAQVIPEEQFLKLAKANLRSTIAFGLCALLIAAGLSIWVSNWLARPLRKLSTDLEHVAAFDIPEAPSPHSHVRETAVVSDAVERLKRALRSFGRYVPVGVVRELIATHRDASREGKEYFITILFSELEMRRSDENIPESLRLLQEYFTIGTELVEMEGSVDKYFGGGGMMALFNEPRPVLNHADAACVVALRWCDEWKRALKGVEISDHHQIRFGINTGTALVGNIGTKHRFAYTAMGDAVNLAHRLMELAFSLDLCILVGEEAHSQISAPFEWRFLGAQQVTGRSGQVSVWELLGEKDAVPVDLLQARNQFEQGLTEWKNKNWIKAQTRFLDALALRPGDCLTTWYLAELKTRL